jgi:hypothetical protein
MNGHNDKIYALVRKLPLPPGCEDPENTNAYEVIVNKIELSTRLTMWLAAIIALLVAALLSGKCRK